ncbi:hypothetical protein A3K55_02660 [Candidatus Shapirobacteria bacterium RBG_13_44_7]|uniref:Uncharacterized protein n=1 Tax=Candidatus Shapirobacteria bacterium RBG_13_44_7 TaxID=1802149 RepID=A0A1F7SJZ4_9BACT|nr:MAG: hypothetical protein A3K55_02660 [Candidatus Shapirobacteria bacterium RBG_13_44_7]
MLLPASGLIENWPKVGKRKGVIVEVIEVDAEYSLVRSRGSKDGAISEQLTRVSTRRLRGGVVGKEITFQVRRNEGDVETLSVLSIRKPRR